MSPGAAGRPAVPMREHATKRRAGRHEYTGAGRAEGRPRSGRAGRVGLAGPVRPLLEVLHPSVGAKRSTQMFRGTPARPGYPWPTSTRTTAASPSTATTRASMLNSCPTSSRAERSGWRRDRPATARQGETRYGGESSVKRRADGDIRVAARHARSYPSPERVHVVTIHAVVLVASGQNAPAIEARTPHAAASHQFPLHRQQRPSAPSGLRSGRSASINCSVVRHPEVQGRSGSSALPSNPLPETKLSLISTEPSPPGLRSSHQVVPTSAFSVFRSDLIGILDQALVVGRPPPLSVFVSTTGPVVSTHSATPARIEPHRRRSSPVTSCRRAPPSGSPRRPRESRRAENHSACSCVGSSALERESDSPHRADPTQFIQQRRGRLVGADVVGTGRHQSRPGPAGPTMPSAVRIVGRLEHDDRASVAPSNSCAVTDRSTERERHAHATAAFRIRHPRSVDRPPQRRMVGHHVPPRSLGRVLSRSGVGVEDERLPLGVDDATPRSDADEWRMGTIDRAWPQRRRRSYPTDRHRGLAPEHRIDLERRGAPRERQVLRPDR